MEVTFPTSKPSWDCFPLFFHHGLSACSVATYLSDSLDYNSLGTQTVCTFVVLCPPQLWDACWIDGRMDGQIHERMKRPGSGPFSPLSDTSKCFIPQIVQLCQLQLELSYFSPSNEVAGLLTCDVALASFLKSLLNLLQLLASVF